MAKSLKIDNKEVKFPEEIKTVLYFVNAIVVLYRKDKEIPDNVIVFDLKGNQLYTINDIIKAKMPRGFDSIERKETILIAECEIGIIYEIDIEKKIILNKKFVR